MGEHFVLLHGAWHGGWCWEGVIDALKQAGHTAEAPTMPGHHAEDDRSGITFAHYVDGLVRILEQQKKPVILAGHSSAGFVIQAAALKVPQRIAGMVFHNAFILPNGKSQFDLVPPEVAQGMTAAAEASPDNCVPILEDFVRGALLSDATVAVQDDLISRLVPQPIALFTTPVSTREFENLDIPKTVLFCKDDLSLPPGAYLQMAQALGEHKIIEMDGGHETLFTHPQNVAEGLMKAIRY